MNVNKNSNNNQGIRYQPSRFIDDFHIAGFTYCDGLCVINELRCGQEVKLVKEIDNPFDGDAIAIFYKNCKIGYVPRNHNSTLSTFLYYGYEDAFEARIQMVDTTNHSESQLRVTVMLKDNR